MVLVTAAPLQPYVDALLEGAGRSQLLTRPGQDAHTALLSPSQAQALLAADIIIVPDAAMNSTIAMQVRKAAASGKTVIALTDLPGADAMPYDDAQPWLGDDDHRPEEPAPDAMRDPHLWLDPLRMAALAEPLAQALAQKLPAIAATLHSNAQALREHLQHEVHPEIEAMLRNRQGARTYTSRTSLPFITDHEAYRYFFARYGIENPGALLVRPEDYLGANTTRAQIKRAGEITLRCVIAEQETPRVRTMVSQTGGRFVRLSPEVIPGPQDVPVLPWIRNGYDRLLYQVAKNIGACL
jgi:zinc transport system substrate-binding protein